MANPLGQGFGILHQQLQVFRGEAIAQLGGRGQAVADHHQAPILNRLAGDLGPGVIRQLGLQGGRQGRRQLLAGGEQNRRRQGVVFGLGQQIGGHQLRRGRVIGNHQHFAGASQRIDRYAPINGLLGQGDVEVAGAGDHIHPRDGLGAVGQGCDRLGAPHPVQLAHPGQVGRRQHRGVGFAARPRWRHHHQPLHAGDDRRHGIHQHGAGV